MRNYKNLEKKIVVYVYTYYEDMVHGFQVDRHMCPLLECYLEYVSYDKKIRLEKTNYKFNLKKAIKKLKFINNYFYRHNKVEPFLKESITIPDKNIKIFRNLNFLQGNGYDYALLFTPRRCLNIKSEYVPYELVWFNLKDLKKFIIVEK
jgi:hypothetical protein